MLKKVCLFFVIGLYFLLCFVSAHPGSLDENNGHFNHETGDYHYHSGLNDSNAYYSGSHSYDYEDYVSRELYEREVKKYEAEIRNYKKLLEEHQDKVDNQLLRNEKLDKSIGTRNVFICFLLLAVFVTICVIFSIKNSYKNKIGNIYNKYSAKKALEHYEKTVFNLFDISQKRLSFYNEMKNTEQNLPEIPENYEIGADNLPKERNSEKWGESLTVYVNYRSKKIHRKEGCSGITHETNIAEISDIHRYTLCKNCCKGYNIPDLDWYKYYINYQDIKTYTQKTFTTHTENVYYPALHETISAHALCNTGIIRDTIPIGYESRLEKLNTRYKFLLEVFMDKELILTADEDFKKLYRV